MELQLKNIGMIKEANVKIDGLTVIAGENDTGKSTLGKVLYSLLASISHGDYVADNSKKNNNKIGYFEGAFDGSFTFYVKGLFNGQFAKDAIINFLYQDICFSIKTKNSITNFNLDTSFNTRIRKDTIPIFIETPLVWSFTDFFRDIAQIESQMKIEVDYPYLMKDLNFKLHIKSASNGLDIKEKVTSLMGGEFKKDEMGRYYFDKNGERIELVNTATGIKYFGIFQVLSQNNYLNKDTVLVLDEPEVHLHPKWQLEMAKIIVDLVKNGVKILVNSHSPYMIEALQRYSKLAEVNSDFYLAEDGYIKKENDSNSETLAKIFEKLSEPFDVFEEMESQSMEKLING